MSVKILMGHKFYTLKNGWKIFEHRDGILFMLKAQDGRDKIITARMAKNILAAFC